MQKLIFLFFILVFASALSYGQEVNEIVSKKMEIARAQMDAGDYNGANKTFREILSLRTVLPHDLSYLFAETLYMIGQYENSRNFLERYLKLTGKAGNYTEQALQLQNYLASKFVNIKTCKLCDIRGYKLATCSNCHGVGHISASCSYCKGVGALKCHICLGEGVIITRNAFSVNEYQTCPKCEGKGYNICPVCNGAKILDQQCPVCLGSGMESTTEICTHPDVDSN